MFLCKAMLFFNKAVYATGPMSFLFSNTIEQHYVAHAMAYSACNYNLLSLNINYFYSVLLFILGIGPYDNKECRKKRGVLTNPSNSYAYSNSNRVYYKYSFIIILNFVTRFFF